MADQDKYVYRFSEGTGEMRISSAAKARAW